MRLIKVTGGLGNQMFIYACYLQMKKRFPRVYIDLTDMMHYHVHYGYEMHRVFGLPCVEICMNQVLKKVIEFLFFKTILERKQHGLMRPYTRSYLWPLIYFKGFYQSEKYFADIKDEVRQAFTFDLKQANGQSLRMREQIDKDEHAVSLHVRRGDYLQPKHWEAIGWHLPAFILSECFGRNGQMGGASPLLCLFGRPCLGEGESGFARCGVYRLEQRRGQLAGHDADEPVPASHHLQ